MHRTFRRTLRLEPRPRRAACQVARAPDGPGIEELLGDGRAYVVTWEALPAAQDQLAREILHDVLGRAPADELVAAFAREVVATLPRPAARVTAGDVRCWILLRACDR